MVKPAFLSKMHYRKQSHELIVCAELVEEVRQGVGISLHASRRLGLENVAESLGVIWDELKAASENMDSAICYLNALEGETR